MHSLRNPHTMNIVLAVLLFVVLVVYVNSRMCSLKKDLMRRMQLAELAGVEEGEEEV